MVIKDTGLEPYQKPPEAESSGLWPGNTHFISLPQTMFITSRADNSCEMSNLIDFLLAFGPFLVSKPHIKSRKPHFSEVYKLKYCHPTNAV